MNERCWWQGKKPLRRPDVNDTYYWMKGAQYPTDLGVYMHLGEDGGVYIKELAGIM
jgi:hypothetical protein